MPGALARKRVAVVAVAVAMVLFAGCGDDDGDDEGGDTTTTEASGGEESSTSEDEGGSETTTPAEGSGDDEAAAFCEDLISFQEQAELAQIDTETEPTEEEVAQFKETFQEQIDSLTELVSQAPDDIAPDLQAQLDELGPVNDEVQAAEQPSDLIDAIGTLAEAGEDPAVEERGTRIEDWVTENCGEAATG